MKYIDDIDNGIYNVMNFPHETITIDINDPKSSQNRLVELIKQVEEHSEMAKSIGKPDNIGEGYVCSAFYNKTLHNFKVKGTSHAASRVKTLKPVDEEYENRKREFANYATPAWRLEQGIQETFDTLNGGEINIKKMGDFLRWVQNDIMKEESSKMSEMNLEPKEVNKTISTIARNWFMEQLDKE